MNEKKGKYGRWLWAILAYGLLAVLWDMGYNGVYHDEALNILMGRQVLGGLFCPGCPQNTGSVLIQPVLAAAGDAAGGLYGARAVGIPFGLGLTAVIFFTARRLCSEKSALLAALLFVFTGTAVYLSKLATYDIISAFFLGASFLLLVMAEGEAGRGKGRLMLFFSAVLLFLSAMTKYVAAVFIIPIAAYAIWRHKARNPVSLFVLPLVCFCIIYFFLALYPVREAIMGSSVSTYEESQVPFSTLSSWTLRWVAMPYLLSAFGLFHKEKCKTVFVLIALSTPIILLHLISGAEQSVNKNVIFSIIFLSPAAALGVDHMGALFSSYSLSSWVKPLFVTAVVAVVWAFGVHELGWLERQYPDMKPVTGFFNEKGFRGMTVVIDSDYGDAIYTYELGRNLPGARFVPITEFMKKGADYGRPDFVIIDGFYGKPALRKVALKQVEDGYRLLRKFKVGLSWGISEVEIYERG